MSLLGVAPSGVDGCHVFGRGYVTLYSSNPGPDIHIQLFPSFGKTTLLNCSMHSSRKISSKPFSELDVSRGRALTCPHSDIPLSSVSPKMGDKLSYKTVTFPDVGSTTSDIGEIS
jgi:hypothetical protein